MTNQVKAGTDALAVLNQTDGGANTSTEFTNFKSGTSYKVKVLGTADLITYFNYGIFGKVNSFVAKKPSKKSQRGFPVEDLTPWDKAWKYHADKSEKFGDKHSDESYKYRCKQRFAMGFIDLDTGKPIIIDFSKNQARVVHTEIMNRKERLDQFAFVLSKQGERQNTSVSLSLIPILDDLTDEQRKNFDNAPSEFDMTLFDGLLYEADEDEQIENLIKAGFDISLIGLEPPAKTEEDSETVEQSAQSDNANDDEYDF